jgi:hypothetical protein
MVRVFAEQMIGHQLITKQTGPGLCIECRYVDETFDDSHFFVLALLWRSWSKSFNSNRAVFA